MVWRTCLIIVGLVVLNAVLAAVILTAVRGFGRCAVSLTLASQRSVPFSSCMAHMETIAPRNSCFPDMDCSADHIYDIDIFMLLQVQEHAHAAACGAEAGAAHSAVTMATAWQHG